MRFLRMKHHFLIAAAVSGLLAGAVALHASPPATRSLTDRELASVFGGQCGACAEEPVDGCFSSLEPCTKCKQCNIGFCGGTGQGTTVEDRVFKKCTSPGGAPPGICEPLGAQLCMTTYDCDCPDWEPFKTCENGTCQSTIFQRSCRICSNGAVVGAASPDNFKCVQCGE